MFDGNYMPWFIIGTAGTTFAVCLGIVAYVLAALGLMQLAQNKGIENAWLAWIPFGNLYILGRIVETVKIGTWEIPRLEIILPLLPIALIILSWIPLIAFLSKVAAVALTALVLYRLFSKYRPEQAVLYTVLSVILGLFWIFVFIIRNDREIS